MEKWNSKWKLFSDVLSQTFSISSILSFQDENAAAQGILAVHGGPVRHFLPPLLQGPPLRLPAA